MVVVVVEVVLEELAEFHQLLEARGQAGFRMSPLPHASSEVFPFAFPPANPLSSLNYGGSEASVASSLSPAPPLRRILLLT